MYKCCEIKRNLCTTIHHVYNDVTTLDIRCYYMLNQEREFSAPHYVVTYNVTSLPGCKFNVVMISLESEQFSETVGVSVKSCGGE